MQLRTVGILHYDVVVGHYRAPLFDIALAYRKRGRAAND
jgi:hypothetical protein